LRIDSEQYDAVFLARRFGKAIGKVHRGGLSHSGASVYICTLRFGICRGHPLWLGRLRARAT
jgi:hypothetical protein